MYISQTATNAAVTLRKRLGHPMQPIPVRSTSTTTLVVWFAWIHLALPARDAMHDGFAAAQLFPRHFVPYAGARSRGYTLLLSRWTCNKSVLNWATRNGQTLCLATRFAERLPSSVSRDTSWQFDVPVPFASTNPIGRSRDSGGRMCQSDDVMCAPWAPRPGIRITDTFPVARGPCESLLEDY
jgi:hypothetical protein